MDDGDLNAEPTCLPAQAPGRLTDGWTAAFLFEAADDAHGTGYIEIETAHLGATDAKGAMLAQFGHPDYPSCLTTTRATWPRRADLGRTVDVGAPGIGVGLEPQDSADAHERDGSTWGHGWCNVRDVPQALIRVAAIDSMVAAGEMWQICNAAVPQVRHNVRPA